MYWHVYVATANLVELEKLLPTIDTTKLVKYVIKTGNITVLVYLYNRGINWHIGYCLKAAKYRQLELLIWLHNKGCPCSGEARLIAANRGYLDILVWELDHCPFNLIVPNYMGQLNYQLYQIAIEVNEDDLAIIKQLWKRNHLDSSFVVALAVKNAKVNAVKWLLKKGYPWNELAELYANKLAYQPMLQIAHDLKSHSAPVNEYCIYCKVRLLSTQLPNKYFLDISNLLYTSSAII